MEIVKILQIVSVTIIVGLSTYAYYLSSKLDQTKYELANKIIEMNLCKADKQIAEAKIELQNTQIKALAIKPLDEKELKKHIKVLEKVEVPKENTDSKKVEYYENLFDNM